MMEFVIDFALVRAVIQAEIHAALSVVQTPGQGALPAYQQSIVRHEQRLAQAEDAASLACHAGCAWCCHFSVDVRAVEAINMAEYVQREFSADEQRQLWVTLQNNAQALRAMDELQRMRSNLPCPFLQQGQCRIYAVRPQTCRNYHATDAAGCQQSYEQPDNDDIAPEFAPVTYQVGAAHVEAFAKVLQEAGYDALAYEINAAMLEALTNLAAARQRLENKLPVFPNLEATEVPMEFVNDDAQ